jgi:hypothetical protein
MTQCSSVRTPSPMDILDEDYDHEELLAFRRHMITAAAQHSRRTDYQPGRCPLCISVLLEATLPYIGTVWSCMGPRNHIWTSQKDIDMWTFRLGQQWTWSAWQFQLIVPLASGFFGHFRCIVSCSIVEFVSHELDGIIPAGILRMKNRSYQKYYIQ